MLCEMAPECATGERNAALCAPIAQCSPVFPRRAIVFVHAVGTRSGGKTSKVGIGLQEFI